MDGAGNAGSILRKTNSINRAGRALKSTRDSAEKNHLKTID
jgi:hypothetical protein